MPNYSINDGIHGATPSVTRTQVGLISAFMTLSLWLALEFHVHVFRIFKSYRSLYFWSLLALAWGIILHSIGYLLNWFSLNCPWEIYAVINAIGWSMMVTGESLVLYSRMHLVTRSRGILRFVLSMIVFTTVFVQIPNWIISIPAVDSDLRVSAVWSPRDSIETRIQQVAFLLQEGTISSLYIWYTGKMLEPSLQIRQRRVMIDLLYVNVIIIILDVVVIVLAFTNQHLIKEPLQNLSYALKLKLEFFVLNQLMDVSWNGFSHQAGMKGRYVAQSVSHPGPTVKNDSNARESVQDVKQNGLKSKDPITTTTQAAPTLDPTMPKNTYSGVGHVTRLHNPALLTGHTSTIGPSPLGTAGLASISLQDRLASERPQQSSNIDITARSWLHLADNDQFHVTTRHGLSQNDV
ncbi:hypothetical protein F5B21DRAFT_521803 [Xylaria acuta]|nr:hypothetical protein F5B21DRAFT_521803 [Xylaria acuta]